jgi:hypothetical protein
MDACTGYAARRRPTLPEVEALGILGAAAGDKKAHTAAFCLTRATR